MDTARVLPVIETTILRKGKGVEGDPIRIVTQYFSLEGELLAQRDPEGLTVPVGEFDALRQREEIFRGALRNISQADELDASALRDVAEKALAEVKRVCGGEVAP